MMLKQMRTVRQNLFLWGGIVLILILSLWNLKNLNIIHVLYDEFGYWSAGAFFAGKDWSEVTSRAAYYSYGYGFLIGLLMRLIETPEVIYKCMVIFNSLCLVGSYLIGIWCIRKFFKNFSFELATVISFLVTLYPNNVIQVQITWPENLLYFLFWVITALMIKIVEQPKMKYIVLLPIVCAYMYVTHMRTLGIVIAVVMTMVVLFLKKGVTWKHILCFAIVIGVLLAGHEFLKAEIVETMWLNTGETALSNDYSSQGGRIVTAFTTLHGFFLLITGYLGKFFALALTTAGLAFLGIWVLLKNSACLFVKKKENETVINLHNKSVLAFFVLLAVLGTVGINAIFMLGGRQDTIIYGRYSENILGPVLVLAVCVLLERCLKLWEYIVVYAIYGVGMLTTFIRFWMTDDTQFNLAANVSVSAFFKDGQSNDYRVLLWGGVIGVVSVLMVVVRHLVFRKESKCYWSVVLIVAVCFGVWVPNINKMWSTIDYTQKTLYTEFDRIREQLQIDGNINHINYLTNGSDSDSRSIQYIQYLMPDLNVDYIQWKEDMTLDCLYENTEDWLVLYGDGGIVLELSDRYAWVNEYWGLKFLVPRGSLLEQHYVDKNWQFKNKENALQFDRSLLGSQNAKEAEFGRWLSNGDAGYIVFGPYVTLGPGNYELVLNCEVLDCKPLSIGNVDVVSGDTTLLYREISLEMQREEKLTEINVNIEIKEETPNLEFRLWIPEGTHIEIKNMELKKLPQTE